MIASIIARKYAGKSSLKLSVRLAAPNLKNAIALGISVSNARWIMISETLKQLSSKHGTCVIEDNLCSQLWGIIKRIELLYEAGYLSLSTAKETILEVLQPDIINEKEKQTQRQEQETKKQQRITLMEWIEEFIRQCEAGERLKRKSTNVITPGTIKSYKGTKAQLEAYQEKRHRVIDFDDVTIDFYDDWRRFFLEKKNKKGVSTPYSPNTIGKHVKNLKIFLFAAKDMKLTTTTDFESSRFVAESQDVENVYLTEERIQELYETDFEDGKTIERLMALAPDDDERDVMKDQLTRRTPKLLNEAKDIFVVGCLTGQRVSDYKRINEEMYRELSDGNEYIYLQQAKTGKWIYIPLDLRVRVILQKYGGKLPHIYDQDLNERIKVVGRMMGWRENAGITELHGMMQIPTSKKFYECIKTHTARRSFATNAYKRKISLSSIMVITGHSSERMLRKYLKLDNEERAILAAAEFEKAKKVKLKAVE